MYSFNHNNSFIQTTPRIRLNYTGQTRAKTDAENLTGGRHRDELATVNFS